MSRLAGYVVERFPPVVFVTRDWSVGDRGVGAFHFPARCPRSRRPSR